MSDDCTTNGLEQDERIDADFGGAVQQYSDGAVLSSGEERLTLEVSVAQGMSGGPHYYCPGAGCDDGHYLTGICSWYNEGMSIVGPNFVVGAFSGAVRASRIRPWIAHYARGS